MGTPLYPTSTLYRPQAAVVECSDEELELDSEDEDEDEDEVSTRTPNTFRTCVHSTSEQRSHG